MIRMDDYTGPDGLTDWKCYREAQVVVGECCRTCGDLLVFGTGYPRDCAGCDRLKVHGGQVEHDRLIRCPACRELFRPGDDYNLFQEGQHGVQCPSCEAEFEIETQVNWTFGSPELISEQESYDGEPDDDCEVEEDSIPA